MKKIALFIHLTACFVLFIAMFVTATPAMPEATRNFYANDFADVLSGETEQYIVEKSAAVAQAHDGMQIVVATVLDLEGSDIDSYANALFRFWGIGDKDKNNGLLILLATEPRKVKIEVGYGLEGDINDAKAGRLLDDYALPHYKNNRFDEGTRTLYDAVLYELGVSDTRPEKVHDSEFDWEPLILLLLLFIILFLNRRRLPFRPYGHYRRGFYGGFRGGFRGGGFGGGGFRGGGGSSGGGGASRGF